MKKCIKCNSLKEEKDFYKHPVKKGETINTCKKCKIEYSIKRNKDSHYHRSKYMKEYYTKNKETILERCRKRDVKKRKDDKCYRIRYNLSHNLRECLKRADRNKNNSISSYVGCTMKELIYHLNSNPYGFKYGDDNIDIDHIIPTSKANNEKELKQLFHYTNLQLLPSYYNRHIKKDFEFNKKDFEQWLTNQ